MGISSRMDRTIIPVKYQTRSKKKAEDSTTNGKFTGPVLNSLNAAPLVSPLDDYTEDDLPLTWKTKTIKRLDPNTYVFYCTSRITTARINKNMIVIENNGSLSLINPLKLTSEGQRKLGNLGKIKNILRLGYSHHGIFEDEYYLRKYPEAKRWAPGPFFDTKSHNLPIHHSLKERGSVPFPNCRVFCFKHTYEPEACIVLERESHGNLLITGDCLQSQKDNEFVNMPVVAKMKIGGLLASDIVVSPAWLKDMGPPATANIREQKDHKKNVRADFQRLLGLKFNRLLSTSGNVVKYGAKEGAVLAVEYAFPLWGSSKHVH